MLNHNFTDTSHPETYIPASGARAAEQEQSDAIDANTADIAAMQNRLNDTSPFVTFATATLNTLTTSNKLRLGVLTQSITITVSNLPNSDDQRSYFFVFTATGGLGINITLLYSDGKQVLIITSADEKKSIYGVVWDGEDLIPYYAENIGVVKPYFTTTPTDSLFVAGSEEGEKHYFRWFSPNADSYSLVEIILKDDGTTEETITPNKPPAAIYKASAVGPVGVGVIAHNVAGDTPSPIVWGKVAPAKAPGILTQPIYSGDVVIAGNAFSITGLTLDGNPPPTGQWQKNTDITADKDADGWLAIPGATGVNLTAYVPTTDAAYMYVATNSEGTVKTIPIVVQVQLGTQAAPSNPVVDDVANTLTVNLGVGELITAFEGATDVDNFPATSTALTLVSGKVVMFVGPGVVALNKAGIRRKATSLKAASPWAINGTAYTQDRPLRNLTMSDDAAYVAGYGSQQALSAGYGVSPTLSHPDSFTVRCRVRRSAAPGVMVAVGRNLFYYIGVTDNMATAVFGNYSNIAQKEIVTTANISDGTWHLLETEFDLAETRLYVDGTLKGKVEFGIRDFVETMSFAVAVRAFGGNLTYNEWDGDIQNVIVLPGSQQGADATTVSTIANWKLDANGNDSL